MAWSIPKYTGNSHIERAARAISAVIINGEYAIENTYSIKCDEYEAVQDCVTAFAKKGRRDILYLYAGKSASRAGKKNGYIGENRASRTGVSGILCGVTISCPTQQNPENVSFPGFFWCAW